ncbi:uncharacterized protein LOC144313014 [Canis aureus]
MPLINTAADGFRTPEEYQGDILKGASQVSKPEVTGTLGFPPLRPLLLPSRNYWRVIFIGGHLPGCRKTLEIPGCSGDPSGLETPRKQARMPEWVRDCTEKRQDCHLLCKPHRNDSTVRISWRATFAHMFEKRLATLRCSLHMLCIYLASIFSLGNLFGCCEGLRHVVKGALVGSGSLQAKSCGC